MTDTQRKADLEIVEIELRRFNLAMCDRWTREDYALDDKLAAQERELTKNYITTYGTNPRRMECKYHNEVVNLYNELRN